MQHSLPHLLGKGVAWGTFSSAGIRVVTLLYLLMVLRELTVYQYGLLELVISMPAFLGLFMLPGLEYTITADMGAEKGRGNSGDAGDILKKYFYLRVVLSAAPFLILFFGSELIARWYNEEIGTMVRIIAFTFLTLPLKGAIQIALRVFARFDTLAFYSLGEEVLKLILVALGLYVFDLGIVSIVYAIVFSGLISALLVLPWCRDIFATFRSKAPLVRRPLYDSVAHHGKWGIFTNYLGSLSNNIRLWVIKLVLGTEAVGLFAVAYGFFQQMTSLFPLHLVIAPYLFETTDERRFQKLVGKGAKYLFLGYALLAVVVGSLAPFFIGYVFPQYVPSLPLFYALFAAIVPMSIASMMSLVFTAKRQQRELFVVTFWRTLATSVAAPIFLTLFGIIGVACEIVLTSAIFAYERYRRARGLMPGFALSWRDFLFFDEEDQKWLRYFANTATGVIRRVFP